MDQNERIAQLEDEVRKLNAQLKQEESYSPAEEKLKKLRIAQETFDKMPNATICITVRDLQTGILKIEYVNATWERITGVTAEASIADIHNVFNNVHPDDLPALMHIIAESPDPLKNFEIEIRYIHPVTKKEIWIVFFSYPRREGNFIFSDVFIFDISIRKTAEIEAERNIEERKRMETELAEYHERLEELVQERTRALLESVRAREKAEEADRLKSTFLANMSHEIRTPLSGIVGLIQIIESQDLSLEQRQELFNMMNISSSHLMNLIDDIIDMSRIEAQQLVMNPVPVHLNALLNELRIFFENYLKSINKGHVMMILNESGLIDNCVVSIDPKRLRQVLNNLIGNAVKFTEKGHIRFGYRQSSPDLLEFVVEDTGIGLPENQQEIVFERFRQSEIGNSRQYGGAGLGLTISRSLVQMMGGTMWVKSTEGDGSSFYFTVPYQPVISD